MLGRPLRGLRGNTAVKHAARVGLLARSAFYLVLAVLAAHLVLSSSGGGRSGGQNQANANGALVEVAGSPGGTALLLVAAVGFVAFGVLRLAGAATDDRHGRWRRLSTAGQGLLYLGMAGITATFLLGAEATGSEQQQRRTAGAVLALPGGRLVLAVLGLVLLGMCTWQLVVAARGHFADTLHTENMNRRARRWAVWTARIGIPARALAVLPVGVLLVVAALRSDPDQAKGLDALLLELTRSSWGRALVGLTAVGFAVFAVYSLLEARYRAVSAGA